jgi:hypothetical protein
MCGAGSGSFTFTNKTTACPAPGVEFVSLAATDHRGVEGRWPYAAQGVHAIRDGFHMRRVGTASNTTQMVNRQTERDGADEKFVSISMSTKPAPVDEEQPIPVVVC